MDIVVQKFGGTSVATVERIIAAARRAIRAHKAGHQVVVVVSARGDTTDDLIAMAREITDQPPAREMDMLLSTGEQISIALMAMAIQSMDVPAISFTGLQIGIQTDSTHTRARIKKISTDRILAALQEGKIVIVAGFQGIDEHANITTLGRGGSDTTAVAIAAAMKHAKGLNGHSEAPKDDYPQLPTRCEIYTDVDGIYTTDPRLVPEARKIDQISYDEMLELASVGAGVMHSRSIEFASKFGVPLQVRSSMSDAPGTEILPETGWMSNVAVCGAALVKDEARITLFNVPDQPGISHQIFSAIAGKDIVVDMIAQNAGEEGQANIGFTVLANELPATLAILQPLAAEMGARVEHEEAVSKVSVVGTGMRAHTGVAERMFAALADARINMKMITTGDIKISVLVDKADGIKALQAVHAAFALGEPHLGSGISPAQQAEEHSTFKKRPSHEEVPTLQDFARLTHQLTNMEDIVVSDVQRTTHEGRITIFHLPNQPGVCTRIFQAIAENGIVVDMIVQNLTPEGAELSFSVPAADLDRAKALTEKVVAGEIAPHSRVVADGQIARLIVVGVGMRTHTGVARKMFGALAAHSINISLINTSEVRISVVVSEEHGDRALQCLREAFRLDGKSG